MWYIGAILAARIVKSIAREEKVEVAYQLARKKTLKGQTEQNNKQLFSQTHRRSFWRFVFPTCVKTEKKTLTIQIPFVVLKLCFFFFPISST